MSIQEQMEGAKLHFLLMGKTGQGKSSTGNTMLNKPAFKASCRATSTVRPVDNNFAEIGNDSLVVVDGLGLENTNLSKSEDTIEASATMGIALELCRGGFDAFLLVIKFGNRFTEEDKMTLETLNTIFGDEFIRHVIVVVTCGDIFQGAMEEEGTPHKSLHDWCKEQDDVFRKLYSACESRFVLFNNWEKDKAKKREQILELVRLSRDIHRRYGRYTSNFFEKAKPERQRLILELEAPPLKAEFQKKICLLVSEILEMSSQPTEYAKEKVRARVQDIGNEKHKYDLDPDVLEALEQTIKKVEENLKDQAKLGTLNKNLEKTRQFKEWGWAGPVVLAVGGVFFSVGLLLGLAVHHR